MTFGHQTTGRVDGNLAAQFCFALLRELATATHGAKTKVLNLLNFCIGGGVVNFDHVHIIWADSRFAIGFISRNFSDVIGEVVNLAVAAAH